ncbi:protein CASC3 isoform X2 [Herrania umbratica]|uniref:Protein CASC3 isoform X2 n=1 Tax=Herrania umbratica TaxID=108875 RepID=A0A6J1BGL3_9ROSI|nr:protein CASC3 isoform X2 [Herrania umbratica]
MAAAGEEDVEYESDPEEVKRSLAMRRREAASDDEEGERGEDNNTKARMDRRAVIPSDESDGQGGAADYDDEDEELDLEEDEEEEEEEAYDEEEEEEEEIDEEEIEEVGKGEMEGNVERTGEDVEEAVVGDGSRNVEDGSEINNNIVNGNNNNNYNNHNNNNNHVGEGDEDEEEKKQNEPFAVPTAGAFYMHDDRFRDNAGGRHRRTHGGRKLWESKDDRKWGHDKFEEMTLQEKHYEDGRRSSRGRYRARSKNRGQDRGYPRGSRSKAFEKNNNQNQASKGVRGRGPRRYEPTVKNSSQAPSTQNKLSGKPLEKTSQANSSRAFTPAANADTTSVPARKHVFASSLSSASPPFYPSGSSNKDITLTPKKDVQTGSVSRNLRPSVTDDNLSVSHSNSLRGKNVLDSLSMAKLYIDDSSTSASGKPLTNLQMLPSESSVGNTSQPSQSRVHGRGMAIPGQKAYQPAPHQSQVNRVSPPTQVNAVQRSPVQGRVQSSAQAAAQQLSQHPGIGSQASSPPKTAMSVSSYESGEVESSETSKSKGALVSKGKSSVQGASRGSFMYGGAQIMGATGNMAVSHGDQNFPAFLPVMQFGGQHPGGLSVPAVGMAFPGYVAQPQLGMGNSEMTWLPVLTGAAGALGATYCSPYIAVDGSYHARPSGQASSTGSSSKENTSNKPNNEWKPSQRPELVSDEFGQRQNNPNKPRRYSEMSFSK